MEGSIHHSVFYGKSIFAVYIFFHPVSRCVIPGMSSFDKLKRSRRGASA
jgi:hypothetical protein